MGPDAPPRHSRPVQSRAMTSTRLWDRAAALPALADGRRRPQVAVLPAGLPSLGDLFDFMRDAELRFATLQMRIEDRTETARGDGRHLDGGRAPPPGRRQGHDDAAGRTARSGSTRSGSRTASWCGPTRASTSSGPSGRSATGRAAWPTRTSRGPRPGLRAAHGAAVRDAARTPSSTRRATARTCSRPVAAGSPGRRSSSGREAILVECDHPRTTEIAGDRPDHHLSLAVDRETGVILRLVESIGGVETRARRGRRPRTGRAAPAVGAAVRLPHRDDDALLTETAFASAHGPEIERARRTAADGLDVRQGRGRPRRGQMTSRSRSISRSSSGVPCTLGPLNQFFAETKYQMAAPPSTTSEDDRGVVEGGDR